MPEATRSEPPSSVCFAICVNNDGDRARAADSLDPVVCGDLIAVRDGYEDTSRCLEAASRIWRNVFSATSIC